MMIVMIMIECIMLLDDNIFMDSFTLVYKIILNFFFKIISLIFVRKFVISGFRLLMAYACQFEMRGMKRERERKRTVTERERKKEQLMLS